ncbi:MAG: multiheme c-type cytochrome, partial [Planctomycetota bacterium]
GWTVGLLIVTAALSGVVLTVQAAFGTHISYAWDLVHIVGGCAVVAILAAHVLTAVRRNRPGEWPFVRRLLLAASGAGLVLSAVSFGVGESLADPSRRQPLPQDYSLRYGANPFAPSLARTDWLWRLDQERRWIAFLEELVAEPGRATPAHLADFLRAARRAHAADREGLRRGERHATELGGLDADAERIERLEAVAAVSSPGVRRERLAALLASVRRDLEAGEAAVRERGGLAPAALSGSQTCGTAGCHPEIRAEWEPSAHRYASRSAFFQLIQGAMAESNGAESTRYCAGCHDPIALFSGAKNIYDEDLSSPGADEGISCAVCHSIVRTDVQGNANYTLAPPQRYLAEDGFVGRFLIRAYPRHHRATFGRPLLQTPEFCGACHKQFIDKEINRATRVQLQNQYDAWRSSHWFVPDPEDPRRPDAERTLVCRDCHMRRTVSKDPVAALRDGTHRHHGTIAANQWLPKLHDLPGADRHVRLTEQWLKGETVIPEIADRWPGGPPVPIALEAPESVRPGEPVKIRVVVDNRKVGHTFPTGPLDVIQAWIDVRAVLGGREIFRSGALDEDGFIQTGSFMLKAEGVDRAGNLIDRHNLWDMVGARFRRVLFPGYSDQQEYTFECVCEDETKVGNTEVEFVAPDGAAGGELVVTATLRYRKVDQTLLNVLYPDGKARAPVTDMSTATARIRVVARG